MNDNDVEFFIDELDTCINEVIISGDEYNEIAPFSSDDDDGIYDNNTVEVMPSIYEESYLSESTEAMTDSDFESSCLSFNNNFKIKNESDTFRDISNQSQIALRPRKKSPMKKKSPIKEIKSEPQLTLKRKLKPKTQYNKDDYYVGRILWAKVKSHPWWPCMIFQSPDGTYYRESGNSTTIHVAYFGPYVERGWVNIDYTMPYEGKMKFDEQLKNYLATKKTNDTLRNHVVCPSKKPIFDASWKEAESALMLNLKNRIETHGISYTSGSESSENDDEEDEDEMCSTRSDLTESVIIKKEPIKRQKMSNDNLFEFERLKLPTFSNSKRILLCFLCLQESDEEKLSVVVNCGGCCGQQFHVACMMALFNYLTSLEPTTKEINYNKCVDCNRNARRCFLCQKLGRTNKKDEMMKCSTGNCNRYYHSSCLYKGPFHQLLEYNRSGSLTCPSHTCHSCYIEEPGAVRQCVNHVRCLMCPAAYHKGDWCIPAGSLELNAQYIICPQHLPMGGCCDLSVAPFMNCVKNGIVNLNSINFKITSFNDSENKDLWQLEKPLKPYKTKSNNVTWCFICTKGGNLICCEKCPASFHQNCLDIKEEMPDLFFCEECQIGKFPRYGEIYWLKIGSYRWWPGQIVHESNAPDKVLRAPHGEGQFLVQFFGTNDYYWMNKTHAFPFEEGDDLQTDNVKKGNDSSSDDEEDLNDEDRDDFGNTKLDRDYQASLKIAGKALEARSRKWVVILGFKNKPSQYRSIKTNIPIGNVRINKPADMSEVPNCECRPGVGRNDLDPCGPSSDCMNRELMYECHPQVCRNGDKCRNQRFLRRGYPKQEIFHTEDRGWALRVLEPLKKGTFVNEYIGELIDETEASRRLKKAHDHNITNFYMMELDGQRIIDAGPAANLSRFMNHSCSPNLFTEKWTVNGDTRIGLFALHNIQIGDELTFNYNFFSLGQTKVQCKCGASNCSGFLGDPPKVSSSSDIVSLNKDHNSESKKSQNPARVKTERKVLTAKKSIPCTKTTLVSNGDSEPGSPTKCVDDDCFKCGQPRSTLVCSYHSCPRVYHMKCINLKRRPQNVWLCPWHRCDDCGRISDYFCSECPTSYCNLHCFDKLIKLSDENLLCSNHEDLFLSQGSPTESHNGSTNATFSITGTDSLPSISI